MATSNILNTCRVCLSETSPNQVWFDKFMFIEGLSEDTKPTRIPIHEAFLATTSLNVHPVDGSLCHPCSELLRVAYKFRIDSINANLKITNKQLVFLDDVKVEPYEVFSVIQNNDNMINENEQMELDESEDIKPSVKFSDPLHPLIKDEPEAVASGSSKFSTDEEPSTGEETSTGEESLASIIKASKKKKRKTNSKPAKLSTVATKEEIEQLLAQAKVEGSDYEYLEENTDYHGRLIRFRCKRCGIKCNGFSGLDTHLKVVHQIDKPYKCVKCERRSSNFEVLGGHMRNFCRGQVWKRKIPAPLPLPIAPSILPDRQRIDLSDFEEIEGELKAVGGTLIRLPRSIKCKRCQARLTMSGIVLHFEEVHGVGRAFKCETCTRRFRDLTQYTAHRKRFKGLCMSTMIRPDDSKTPGLSWRRNIEIKCDLCTGFNDVESYTKHMLLSHKITLPFKCKNCIYRGKVIENLTAHKLVCKNNKEAHQCKICFQNFRANKGLAAHTKKVHKPEKDYSCSKCICSFDSAEKLDSHYKVKHLHIRPYTCGFCYKEFVVKTTAIEHVVKWHMTPDMTCRICDTKLLTQELYRFHLEKHHKNDPKYEEVLEDINKIQMPNAEKHITFNPEFNQ